MTKTLWFACALLALPAFASATTVVTDNLDLTTVNNSGGGNTNGTGVWFNPLTGYNEPRGATFPSPLLEDGKFFLIKDTRYIQTEAEIFTEGTFARGNDVIYASSTNLNPARFGDGASIGPGVGYQNAGAGYPDLGPTFGNWASGGHGYIGLLIRDASGANPTDVFYGYAEVNINPDFSTTLLSFAYNDVRGQAITTASTVPEPTTLATMAIAGLGLLRRQR